MKILNRINQKLPRILGILFDDSEIFEDNPLFRYQIIKQIWNENIR